jgi:AcrR family transcriptional regulator
VENCGVIGKRPRERIIGTARELFRRYGLRGIGVDAIAEAAGTNKITMYRHFRSKEQLVVACLQQAIGEAEAVWERIELDYSGCPSSAPGFTAARPASAMMDADATWPTRPSSLPRTIIRRGG